VNNAEIAEIAKGKRAKVRSTGIFSAISAISSFVYGTPGGRIQAVRQM
jgi:hypothetical protein